MMDNLTLGKERYSRLCLNPCPSVDTQSHGFSWSISVAAALAGVFAILINKICKIMEIFE